MVAWADAEVVGGRGINVQLRRDAGTLQGQVHDHAVIGGTDDVVPAVRQKDRGRPGRDAQPGSEFVLVLGLQVARVGQNGEVRPATGLVDVVDRLVGSLLEARRRGDGQMAARRETDHADLLRIDAPLRALLRTRLTARWASWSGRRAGSPLASSGRRGTRYLRMMPVTPSEFSQAATSSPSSCQ